MNESESSGHLGSIMNVPGEDLLPENRLRERCERLQAENEKQRVEIEQLRTQNTRLRKIAAHVPAMDYIKAKEAAGFAEAVTTKDTTDSKRKPVAPRGCDIGAPDSLCDAFVSGWVHAAADTKRLHRTSKEVRAVYYGLSETEKNSD